ncbi:hypothetical protein [Erythrobacter sp. JK5]|uniref:hypothetical protein n=1 Tax=Erythrobacter sp. JK5 TaxID=2829500 RepID=UPI001BA5E844|nr:hypothetical protein [Erythrobacter sp. JK5]QUL37175.1 hypothetical protein KDC96_12395 [Erythrobacter sp. JK5]
MRLFSSDLYRNFGIGFLAGAVLIGATSIDDWTAVDASLATSAQAAEMTQPDVEIASEFLIEED